MKIGFISSKDPYDKRSWSGTIYSLFHTIKKQYDVEWVNAEVNESLIKLININTIVQTKLFKKRYDPSHTLRFSKYLGKKLNRIINNSDYDILFAPAASQHIAFLNTNIPIIYLSDATLIALVGYYNDFSNVLMKNKNEGDLIEKLALGKADKVILSSEWAADSAKQYYMVDSNKIHVIPFGANLTEVPEHEEAIGYEFSDQVKLLFIGAEWERKGGNIAIDALKALDSMGINAMLTIVGCNPKINIKNVEIIPYLDKNNEEDYLKLYSLLNNSTFLVLPTRADCTPIIYCEASAFGMPIITTNTGGVSSHVKDGENGFLLSLSAKGRDYASKIVEIYGDKERYLGLRRKARLKYEKQLNWDRWLEKFNEVVSVYNIK